MTHLILQAKVSASRHKATTPHTDLHPLSKLARVHTLLGNYQDYKHLVLENNSSLRLCRCQGGLPDEMCPGPATKKAQAAGPEATPQLASCHLLICMHFMYHKEATESMKYISYLLFCVCVF